jgi:hypothetical protein
LHKLFLLPMLYNPSRKCLRSIECPVSLLFSQKVVMVKKIETVKSVGDPYAFFIATFIFRL